MVHLRKWCIAGELGATPKNCCLPGSRCTVRPEVMLVPSAYHRAPSQEGGEQLPLLRLRSSSVARLSCPVSSSRP
eukprot:398068-Alexandrium_andersonii.AAC.1